jgi:hypothetical protein
LHEHLNGVMSHTVQPSKWHTVTHSTDFKMAYCHTKYSLQNGVLSHTVQPSKWRTVTHSTAFKMVYCHTQYSLQNQQMALSTHRFLKTEGTRRNNTLIKKKLQSTVDQEWLIFCHLQMTGDKIPVILFPKSGQHYLQKVPHHLPALFPNTTCSHPHIPLLATYISQVTPNTPYYIHQI